MELLLQLHYRYDDRMLNGNFNIRVFRKHVERIDKDHEFEIYKRASALLEMWELGCGYALLGQQDALLLLRGDLPN